jgi:hypothetical protein
VAQEYLEHKMIWALLSISIMMLALFYFYYMYISKKQIIKLRKKYNDGEQTKSDTEALPRDETRLVEPIEREPSVEGNGQLETGCVLSSTEDLLADENSREPGEDVGTEE